MYAKCMLSMQRSQRKKWADASRHDDHTHVDVATNIGILPRHHWKNDSEMIMLA